MAGKYCLIFLLAVLGIGNAMAFTHQTLSKVEMSQWLCGMTHNKLVDGKKQGIWITVDSGNIIVTYYDHGMKDGQELWYGFGGDLYRPMYILHSITMYDDGVPEEEVSFGGGIVDGILETFETNHDFVPEGETLNFNSNGVQFYSIEFDEDANKIAEGWYIFDPAKGDDYVIDSFRVGEWRFYTPNGDLREKVVNPEPLY